MSVGYNPDGELIATGGDDGLVRLFDARTGDEIRTLRKHDGPAAGVAYSPDGKWVLSGGRDGGFHLTDGERNGGSNRVASLPADSQDAVTSVAYCPNGLSFATASRDRITLWGPGVALTHILTEHTDIITSVAYNPDCSRIASGSRDSSVRVWDVVSRQCVLTLRGHSGPVNCIAYSPDGQWIVSGSSDNTLKVWDATTGTVRRTLRGHQQGVNAVSIRGDGRQIASGGDDQAVLCWDVDGDRTPHKIVGPSGAVIAVAYSPDGKRVAGSQRSEPNSLKIWDVSPVAPRPDTKPEAQAGRNTPRAEDAPGANGGPRPRQTPGKNKVVRPRERNLVSRANPTERIQSQQCAFHTLAYSPDGQRIATASHQTVTIWNAQTWDEIHSLIGHEAAVESVAFSLEGDRIVSCGDTTLKVWNAETGAIQKTLQGHTSFVMSAAFSPDGKTIVSVSSQPENTLRVWDAATYQELFARKFEESGRGAGVAFSPDGTQIVCVHESQSTLFDSTTGAPIRDISLRGDRSPKVLFSPDGRRVVIPLKTADVATGQELLSLKTHTGADATSNAVYSPDGKTIACGDASGAVLIWDADSGNELAKIFGNPGAILGVAFSPDGKSLVTGCAEPTTPTGHGQIKLWNVDTGDEMRTFLGRPDPKEPAAGAPPAPARGGARAPRPALDRNAVERAARAAAMKGDWKEAARGYAQMFAIQPIDNGEPGFESAAVLLLAGDKKGYRQRSAQLLEKSGTAGIRGYHVAWACTLASDAVEDFAVPAQKGAMELKGSREFWSLTEQGALACRAGRHDEAVSLLERSLRADSRPGTAVLNWLWLALVEHGRGQPAESRAWLEKANAWMDQVSPEGTGMPAGVDGLHLHNWLEALILRQ